MLFRDPSYHKAALVGGVTGPLLFMMQRVVVFAPGKGEIIGLMGFTAAAVGAACASVAGANFVRKRLLLREERKRLISIAAKPAP